MKIYRASGIFLSKIAKSHRGSNGNCQVQIMCRCKNRKRLSELVGSTESQLRNYNMVQELTAAPFDIGFDTIYYTPDRWIEKPVWFEYKTGKEVKP